MLGCHEHATGEVQIGDKYTPMCELHRQAEMDSLPPKWRPLPPCDRDESEETKCVEQEKPLPVLRDMHGQIIREFDILRVFHFYGRRRGKGREKHYMYKIAVVKKWNNPRIGRQWWFHHTAEMGTGLTNGYCPYQGIGDQWGADQTLEGVEVLDSPATLHDKVWGNQINPPKPN